MADETKTPDISTPFIFQTSPPYAAPGDHYQYDLYWLVNQLKQALNNTETLRLHDIGQDSRLDGLDALTAQLKEATCQLFAKLKAGDFTKDTFIEWVNTNMTDIIYQWCGLCSLALTMTDILLPISPQAGNSCTLILCLTPINRGMGIWLSTTEKGAFSLWQTVTAMISPFRAHPTPRAATAAIRTDARRTRIRAPRPRSRAAHLCTSVRGMSRFSQTLWNGTTNGSMSR